MTVHEILQYDTVCTKEIKEIQAKINMNLERINILKTTQYRIVPLTNKSNADYILNQTIELYAEVKAYRHLIHQIEESYKNLEVVRETT